MLTLILLFTVSTIINVILSTVKTIVTVKSGKFVASALNAITYGFYNYVIILTTIDGIGIFEKCLITALCNFVGVWIVKLIEEKSRKDKLWLVKMTIPKSEWENVKEELKLFNIPNSYVDIDKYVIFDTYCYNQKDTSRVQEICNKHYGKMFASENVLAY